MSQWTITQGVGGSWTVTALDSNGDPVEFIGTETLSGNVWPGGNRASLITLAPTWLDPPAGTSTVTISAVDSALLDSAIYQVRCTVTDEAGLVAVYYRGSLLVQASPGAGTELPTYVEDDDLKDFASWIEALEVDSDQTGFGRQRGKAREWLDDVILSRWKPTGSLTLGDPGYGARSYGQYLGDGPSKWLKDQLAADKLIITPLVKEIVAKRALYLICKSQLGRNGDHSYQDLARSFRSESEEMLKTYRAEIDLDGSGYASIIVNCGATNLRP